MHEINWGTPVEKARAALCRIIAGCEGSFFFPCDSCGQYEKIDLETDEYMITMTDQVFIKKTAVSRERQDKFGKLKPQGQGI